MKKQTFLKLAMTLTAMFFISGVFSQITLNIKNSDGTDANGAIVYTKLSSAPGTETTVQTATALGVATWTPANGSYNYLIRNSAGDRWASYSVTYTGVVIGPITIYLSSSSAIFNPTIQDYSANRTLDKVTRNKPMPFWVYPSPIHNPSWVAPATVKALPATIVSTLSSTFAWTYTPAANVTDAHAPNNDNYVELTFTPDLSGSAVSTLTYEFNVLETSSAAYGACTGSAQKFYARVINPPYFKITTAVDAATYQVGGLAANVIRAGCDGAIPASNVAFAFDNTEEEFPYYMKLGYNIYNATMATNNITLGANITAATITANPTLQILGFDGSTTVNATTNPYRANAAGNLYAADRTFVMMNNQITVYEYNVQSWNAKISRKSDYIAFRTVGTEADITDARYSWYSTKWLAADVIKAYIVVFPKPITGPIYHIANTWGL